ncbi:MAG: S8 family serine peptidase, partial [Candidatus Aminicenantales bacterium]
MALIGADLWKTLTPFRNAVPAKVCVLDAGFEGYTSLLGSDLPKTVTAKSFRADGDITGGGEQHGAACAEIVYDMAPNAQMYLVNFDTDVEQHNAVDWIVSQGIDVISYSLAWYNAGAGDGTGPIDDDVAYAASQNMAWASAAGNSAQSHWTGQFFDPDKNGYMNFDASGTEILSFHVPANETVGVFLNWKDWGVYDGYDYPGSAQDYDLELYLNDGGTWKFIDSSNNPQTGDQWPVEEVYGYSEPVDGTWGLKIKNVHTTATPILEVLVMGNDTALQYYDPTRSVQVPADSAYAWAAGATWVGDDSIEYYSSQGPTWDGRLKPDFTSPDGVSTTTYGPQNFFGTS